MDIAKEIFITKKMKKMENKNCKNHRNNFLIVLISAVVTIGILFGTIGQPPYIKHFEKMHRSHGQPNMEIRK